MTLHPPFRYAKTWLCSQPGCGEIHEPPHKKDTSDMTDDEFLRYCETHCETERAGFVKQNIDRLTDMMGEPRMALMENQIYSIGPGQMLPMVARARTMLQIKKILESWVDEWEDGEHSMDGRCPSCNTVTPIREPKTCLYHQTKHLIAGLWPKRS